MLTRLIHLNISKYFLVSCLASVVDLSISSYLYHTIQINYLLACNLGIAAGFLFQFFVSMRIVFNSNKLLSSFIVYLSTFAIGLMLASGVMWTSYNVLELSFIYSKLMSMVVPFFIIYYIRRTLLGIKTGGSVKYENLL